MRPDVRTHSTSELEIYFVRHAESIANAGQATTDPWSIGLSSLGEEQARALARSRFVDGLCSRVRDDSADIALVVSRMARTTLTITKTAQRIADARPSYLGLPIDALQPAAALQPACAIQLDQWPIDEFTFLSYTKIGAASTIEDRRRLAGPYWDKCDPAYRDGHDAESFSMFRARVRDTLARLQSLAANIGTNTATFSKTTTTPISPLKDRVIVLVSHNRTMLMLMQECLWPTLNDTDAMQHFRDTTQTRLLHADANQQPEYSHGVNIPNTGILPMRVTKDGTWLGTIRSA